jgi:hypothetical protein
MPSSFWHFTSGMSINPESVLGVFLRVGRLASKWIAGDKPTSGDLLANPLIPLEGLPTIRTYVGNPPQNDSYWKYRGYIRAALGVSVHKRRTRA